jgi:hypothetical protein
MQYHVCSNIGGTIGGTGTNHATRGTCPVFALREKLFTHSSVDRDSGQHAVPRRTMGARPVDVHGTTGLIIPGHGLRELGTRVRVFFTRPQECVRGAQQGGRNSFACGT